MILSVSIVLARYPWGRHSLREVKNYVMNYLMGTCRILKDKLRKEDKECSSLRNSYGYTNTSVLVRRERTEKLFYRRGCF